MKRTECTKCGHAITLLRGINCRVVYVEREYDETYMTMIVTISAYCAECGEKSTYELKHYFTRDFDKIPTDYLVDIVLYSNDVSFSV